MNFNLSPAVPNLSQGNWYLSKTLLDVSRGRKMDIELADNETTNTLSDPYS